MKEASDGNGVALSFDSVIASSRRGCALPLDAFPPQI